MTLSDEALEYWKVCQEYRESLTISNKSYIANIKIPTLHLRASNTRIINQLFKIMEIEGVAHVEDKSTNPSC